MAERNKYLINEYSYFKSSIFVVKQYALLSFVNYDFNIFNWELGYVVFFLIMCFGSINMVKCGEKYYSYYCHELSFSHKCLGKLYTILLVAYTSGIAFVILAVANCSFNSFSEWTTFSRFLLILIIVESIICAQRCIEFYKYTNPCKNEYMKYADSESKLFLSIIVLVISAYILYCIGFNDGSLIINFNQPASDNFIIASNLVLIVIFIKLVECEVNLRKACIDFTINPLEKSKEKNNENTD